MEIQALDAAVLGGALKGLTETPDPQGLMGALIYAPGVGVPLKPGMSALEGAMLAMRNRGLVKTALTGAGEGVAAGTKSYVSAAARGPEAQAVVPVRQAVTAGRKPTAEDALRAANQQRIQQLRAGAAKPTTTLSASVQAQLRAVKPDAREAQILAIQRGLQPPEQKIAMVKFLEELGTAPSVGKMPVQRAAKAIVPETKPIPAKYHLKYPKAAPKPVTAAIPPAARVPGPSGLPSQAAPKTVAAGGGVPPQQPPTGTGAAGAVPPGGAIPKGSTPAIQDALSQAKAIVDRDTPGLVTRIIDYIPGPKQAQRGLHPSLGMSKKVLEPWVAEGNVLGKAGTTLAQGRIPVVNRLKEVFGDAVVRGAEKSKIRFIGTRAEAKYPATGTFYDIAQNPELYLLSSTERAAIEESETVLSALFDQIKAEYALDIGKFPNRPGSMFLSNIEMPEAGKGIFETVARTAKSGRAKTRFYETGRERWAHDVERGIAKPFDPVVDVEQLLGAEMHDSLTKMAGRTVYKTGLGGLDRMEALTATGHGGLVKKMVGLRTRLQNLQAAKGRLSAKQQEAITEFLASPLEDADLTALHQGLEPTIVRGVNVGMDVADISKEIAGIRAQITALQPAWKTANTKGYQFVQEGIFKYFPDADAKQIRRLAEVSNNPLLRWIDDLRATAFGGDLSPVSIQMLTAWLSDPIGVSAAIAKRGARGAMFTEEGMLAYMKANPHIVSRFTRGTGINPLGGVDKEFAVGLVGKLPKVGKLWTEFNETVYRPVMRLTMDIFDNSYTAAIKRGLSEEQAIAIAADDATKIIPRFNARRLGMSQAEAARYRSVLTSVSFLTQPAALMGDATKALIKIGTKQTITPSEQFALKRVLKIIAVTEALAVSSSVAYAIKEGQDPKQAALNALNPTHPNFMAITTPWGAKVGLGGPFRSLIRAVVPRMIPGVPVPVPFAGIYRFGMSKMGPGVRSVYEVAPGVNRDYRGRTIRKHDSVPLDILRTIEHVISGNLPLTVGSGYRTLREGEGVGRAGEEALSQFAGTNYIPFDSIWDAKVRWTSDFKEYDALPSNDQEADEKGVQTRDAYRIANPEIEAKLLITGGISSLVGAPDSFDATVRLMRENGIGVADLPSLQPTKYESAARKYLREEIALQLAGPAAPPTAPATQRVTAPGSPTQTPEQYVREVLDRLKAKRGEPVGATR